MQVYLSMYDFYRTPGTKELKQQRKYWIIMIDSLSQISSIINLNFSYDIYPLFEIFVSSNSMKHKMQILKLEDEVK